MSAEAEQSKRDVERFLDIQRGYDRFMADTFAQLTKQPFSAWIEAERRRAEKTEADRPTPSPQALSHDTEEPKE